MSKKIFWLICFNLVIISHGRCDSYQNVGFSLRDETLELLLKRKDSTRDYTKIYGHLALKYGAIIKEKITERNVTSFLHLLLLRPIERMDGSFFSADFISKNSGQDFSLLRARYIFFVAWVSRNDPFLNVFLKKSLMGLRESVKRKYSRYLNRIYFFGNGFKDQVEEVKISAATIYTGSHPEMGGDVDDLPGKRVAIKSFWMDKYEVTYKRYVEFLNLVLNKEILGEIGIGELINQKKGVYYLTDKTFADHPVTHVSYIGALKFCQFYGKDLPLEQEWLRVAKGKSNRVYPWGDKFTPEFLNGNFNNKGNEKRGAKGTVPVNSYADGASEDGVFNLAGNVWEWTRSGYSSSTKTFIKFTPVIKGGSFKSSSDGTRNSYRGYMSVEKKSPYVGFRCIRRNWEESLD